jgi:hypothetical protein
MTTSKQYICIYKIILKIIKLLTLSVGEASAGGVGAGAGGVGDGGRGSGGRGLRRGGSSGVGMVTKAATGSCSGAGWASGREVVGRGLCLGGGRGTLRRRRLHCGGGAGFAFDAMLGWLRERQNETMRARASVKIQYFRRPLRRPSDISLCPTTHLTVVGSSSLLPMAARGRRT